MTNIFDVLGPVMVGPSSSHTAGAVRIGKVARELFGCQPDIAKIYLHGSFATTGKGHGTDKALVAGLLGMEADDMRISESFKLACESGMDFSIEPKSIKGAHPNTAVITMNGKGRDEMTVEACSIGGGRIIVKKIDDIDVNFSGESNTLIIRNNDEPGRIRDVSEVLGDDGINIATMQVFRSRRGGMAVMVVETDQEISPEEIKHLQQNPGIIRVKFIRANSY